MSNPPGPLLEAVRHNCHIADALHAGDYTLCTYLMKMRELYRWENGLPLQAELDSEKVGEWVRERESWWEQIEAEEYRHLPLHDGQVSAPFEHDAINQDLVPQGMVYSAGLGRGAAAHFFLAELLEQRETNGFKVLISGREWARDLVSPPAMMRDNVIYLRRESLQRLLWERVQEWRWNRCDSPLGRALMSYDLDSDIEAGLSRLVDDQMHAVLLHEIGEVMVGQDNEAGWQQLLMAVSGRKAELLLRAVRDNLADMVSTMPELLAEGRQEMIHFWFGTLGPMRRFMLPRLLGAYQRWLDDRDLSPLEVAVEASREHWQALYDELLQQHDALDTDGVIRLVEERRFL